MSATGEICVDGKPKGTRPWLKKHSGIQFAIAVAGSIISWRLSSPRWVHLPTLSYPSSFCERFLLAGPPLLGLGLCMLLIFWGAILVSLYGDNSEPRMVSSTTTWRRLLGWLAIGAILVCGTVECGQVYVRFLWPSQVSGILQATTLGCCIAVWVGLFQGVRGKNRQVGQSETGSDAKKATWINRRQVLFLVVISVTLAVNIGIHHPATVFAPSHVELITRASLAVSSLLLAGFFFIPTRD